MTKEQIDYMANRFLQWPLPTDFNPDGGVSFDPIANAGTANEFRRQPVGTNLLDAHQAADLIAFLVDGLPAG